MSGLSASLTASLTNPIRCETTSFGAITVNECEYMVGRMVLGGEVLGSASQSGPAGIDYGLRDSRHTRAIANPSRWLDWLPHTVCPVDYYEPALRAQLDALFGAFGTRRTVAPLCGRIDFDVPGTAQGIWFRNGGTTFDQGVLSLIADNVLPEAWSSRSEP